jgi:hypothetical protein
MNTSHVYVRQMSVESNVSRDPEIKSVSLKVMLDSNGILKDAHLAGPGRRGRRMASNQEGCRRGEKVREVVAGRLQHPGQGRRLQAFLLRPPCRSCGYGLPARPPLLSPLLGRPPPGAPRASSSLGGSALRGAVEGGRRGKEGRRRRRRRDRSGVGERRLGGLLCMCIQQRLI